MSILHLRKHAEHLGKDILCSRLETSGTYYTRHAVAEIDIKRKEVGKSVDVVDVAQ